MKWKERNVSRRRRCGQELLEMFAKFRKHQLVTQEEKLSSPGKPEGGVIEVEYEDRIEMADTKKMISRDEAKNERQRQFC